MQPQLTKKMFPNVDKKSFVRLRRRRGRRR